MSVKTNFMRYSTFMCNIKTPFTMNYKYIPSYNKNVGLEYSDEARYSPWSSSLSVPFSKYLRVEAHMH